MTEYVTLIVMALVKKVSDILDSISTSNTDVSTINDTVTSQLDELETIASEITSADSKLDAIRTACEDNESNTSNIETGVSSMDTKLSDVNTNLGTIETDIESTNTKLDTINTTITNQSDDKFSIVERTGDVTWTDTSNSGYFDASDYSSTYAKGNFENTTGGDILVNALQVVIRTTSQNTTWDPNALFGSTNSTSTFVIGTCDTAASSTNTLSEQYLNLGDEWKMRMYLVNHENVANTSQYMYTYKINCSFIVTDDDFFSIKFRSNMTGSGVTSGRAIIYYSKKSES